MEVNRESFLKALESVESGLSDKDILEQSSCVVFQNGRVYTYNDQVSCNAPSKLDESFSAAVRAKPLIEILKKFKDDTINIETTDVEFVVVGKRGRRKSGIRMEKEIFLAIEVVEKAENWEKLHDDFIEAVGIVQQCAGNNQEKIGTTCLHLHQNWIEASDDYQLCRWTLDTKIKQNTLVLKNSIQHICKIGVEEFSETENWIHFKNVESDIIFSCRKLIADDYPDLGMHIGIEGTVVIFPKGITEALEGAYVFTSENSDNDLVVMELHNNRMKVKGQGITGWFTENEKIKYEGPRLSFAISPKLLSALISKHDEFILTEDKLRINGGCYEYIAVLSSNEEEEKKEDE